MKTLTIAICLFLFCSVTAVAQTQPKWEVKQIGDTTTYSYRLSKNYKLDIKRNSNTISFIAYDYFEFKYHTYEQITLRRWSRSWELVKKEWVTMPINQNLYKTADGTVWFILRGNTHTPTSLWDQTREIKTEGPDLMAAYLQKKVFDFLPKEIKAEAWHLQSRLKPDKK